MRRSFGSSQARLLFLVLVVILSMQATRVASRFLRPPLTPGSAKLHGVRHVEHAGEESNSWQVLEVEEREDGNEGCLKRRITSDVHLDYIYTQTHKP